MKKIETYDEWLASSNEFWLRKMKKLHPKLMALLVLESDKAIKIGDIGILSLTYTRELPTITFYRFGVQEIENIKCAVRFNKKVIRSVTVARPYSSAVKGLIYMYAHFENVDFNSGLVRYMNIIEELISVYNEQNQ